MLAPASVRLPPNARCKEVSSWYAMPGAVNGILEQYVLAIVSGIKGGKTKASDEQGKREKWRRIRSDKWTHWKISRQKFSPNYSLVHFAHEGHDAIFQLPRWHAMLTAQRSHLAATRGKWQMMRTWNRVPMKTEGSLALIYKQYFQVNHKSSLIRE